MPTSIADVHPDLATAPPGDPTAIKDPLKTRVAERVTVNLSQRSAEALTDLTRITGDTKTEAINKALQVYALIQNAQHRGGAMWLQDNADAESVRVRFY